MPEVYTCMVLASVKLNETCRDLRIVSRELSQSAVPGQFVHIQCDGKLLRRPISVCDADGEVLRIVVDTRGEGTKWLASRKMGDELNILGPIGRGFDVSGERILVVGGGIGVPPLLYAAKRTKEAHAVLGFRNAGAVILMEDFAQCCASVALTTDDGSIGMHGYVDAAVRTKLGAAAFDRVLACGPKPMLKAVARVCGELGVPLQVSLEERMACGVGACLGCACKTAMPDGGTHYRHVCKDGPVFDAEEVVWDD